MNDNKRNTPMYFITLLITMVLCLMSTNDKFVVEGKLLGIDLGSEFMKVSIIRPGSPMEIVTNVHSKRKTENIVAFYNSERSYGGDAATILTKKPQTAYARLTTLLGRNVDHPAVQRLNDHYFPTQIYYNDTKGGICIAHEENEDDYFTPEELAAMVLTHVKDISKAFGGIEVLDSVILVPSYFTQLEKEALINAADIAGLNVMGLMDENAGAALNYAMDRTFEEEETVLIYNMGANSLQVSVNQFSSYKVKEAGKNVTRSQFEVLSKTWDESLGGSQFDLVLAEYLADEFNKFYMAKTKKADFDIRTIPRPMAKLRAQSKKVKEVLSANQKIPVHVASLYDDRDFASEVTRNHFEEMAGPLFSRALEPVKEALKIANLTVSDLTGVEIIGGGVRIPKIQQMLKTYLQVEALGLHLNGDEAMAMGAAFHAANMSKTMRARKCGMTDITPFNYAVEISNLPAKTSVWKSLFGGSNSDKTDEELTKEMQQWSKGSQLFEKNCKLGKKRTIKITHENDINVKLSLNESAAELLGYPSLQTTIAYYNITGIEDFAKEMADKNLDMPEIKIQFELDNSGMVDIVSATASVEEPVIEEEEEEEEVAEEEVAEEGVDPKEGETKEGETKEGETKEGESKEGESKEGETKEDFKVKKSKKTTKKKPKVYKRILKIQVGYDGLAIRPATVEELSASKKKLDELDRQDQIRIDIAEAKNTLESYIYEVKNKMYDEEDAINEVSTEEQREEVFEKANTLDDWLYDEGADLEAKEYRAKKRELEKLFEAIMLRVRERIELPKMIKSAEKKFTEYRNVLTKWNTTMPHINETEKQTVIDLIEKQETWISEKMVELEEQEAHEEPSFVSTMIPGRMKPLKELMTKLSKKPKPIPPKPKVPKNETKSSEKAETEETTTSEEETPTNIKVEIDNDEDDTVELGPEDFEEAESDEFGEL